MAIARNCGPVLRSLRCREGEIHRVLSQTRAAAETRQARRDLTTVLFETRIDLYYVAGWSSGSSSGS